jgi:sulfur dioxygenase
MIFHQLFDKESSTYTYLLADSKTLEAVLIDTVLENVERDLKLIKELGLKLLYVLDTHIHADHVTGAGEIRKSTGAKTAVGKGSQVDCADILFEDGQELKFGAHSIKVIMTPGHTDSCVSYLIGEKVFTGDALLIRGTGRTDFQQGSSQRLFESITQKLFRLPPQTLVFPAHDYKGQDHSTIADEMKHNPRINSGVTLDQFVKTMSELKLGLPAKIHEALPANMACGQKL